MKKLKLSIFLILFLHIFLYSQAQYTIRGTLVDSTGQSIKGAALVVMNAKDSTSIVWEYAKEKDFSIRYDNPEKKTYMLYIQSYGYKSIYMELLPQDQDLGKIILQPLSYQLAEASIIGEASLKYNFVRGKDEFTIPKVMSEQEFDLNTLLAHIPGLTVDGDKVSIVGRGTPVYTINGLKPRPGDIAALSPKDIEKIVIDRMPSARWDKNVVGIIDIVTRKTLKDYMNFRLTNDFIYQKEPINTSTVSVNNKTGRWTNYISYSYQYLRRYYESLRTHILHGDKADYERIYTQSPLLKANTHTLNFSPKFQINEKSFIDLQYFYQNQNINGSHPKTFEIAGSERDISNGTSKSKDDDHNLILRYVYETQKGNRLVLNSGYSNVRKPTHFINQERITDTSDHIEMINTEYSGLFSNQVFSFTANSDFNIGKKLMSESGIEFAKIWNKSSTIYKEGNTYKTNTEEIQATAYFNLGQQIGKLAYQIGIRGEYLYRYDPKNKDVNTHPWSFLPLINLNYNFSKVINMTLYYRRTTAYPTLEERDPILHYVNKYEYLQGNPELKSYIENEFSYRVRLPKNLSVSLSYVFGKNPIIQMDDIYHIETKQTISTYHNFPKRQNFNANVTWNGRFGFYSLYFVGTYYQTWTKSPFLDGFQSYHKPMLKTRVQQTFRINPHASLNLYFNYQTPYDEITARFAESYDLSAMFMISFFKRKLTATIACNNIINTDVHIRGNYKSISFNDKKLDFKRQFRLGITYNFNNFRDIFKKNDSNANVLKRVH